MARALQSLPDEVTTTTKRGAGRDSTRGFTLIELMIVVSIVGILALLAVMGYRKIISSSKTAEAIQMVGAIKVAQEAVRSETGAYVNASSALGVNGANLNVCYPKAPALGQRAAWAGRGNAAWDSLNVQSAGDVTFGYTARAGAAGVAVSGADFKIGSTAVAWPASGSVQLNSSPWYIIGAENDNDGNGIYVSVVLSSWTSGVMIDAEGE